MSPRGARERQPNPLMTSVEVAAVFKVDRKTVYQWQRLGKLTAFKTLGGHWRYRRAEVQRLRDRRSS